MIQVFQSLINPFEVDDETKVCSIASGTAASDEIVLEVLNAEEIGIAAKESSLKKDLRKL